MVVKQFSLEEYLKNPSRKVVTKDGRKARIICADRNGIYPVVALVNNGGEDICVYDERGIYAGNKKELSLFFAPEKHVGWVNVCRYNHGVASGGEIYNSIEETMENANDYFVSACRIEWEE